MKRFELIYTYHIRVSRFANLILLKKVQRIIDKSVKLDKVNNDVCYFYVKCNDS